ncbi:SGNH/GDSL hydrolase family protein [Colwellia sp. KU-HH00111]|uniref:SGNH/GDSL hydrolase family protein n=1 Tax=Colwellia sp. KU-HH00111 TaxID=3127652 RepID=UPI00310B3A87
MTLLISPLLLVQALWVKLTIVRLPEPSGERIGTCELTDDSPPNLKLLIIGDSAAAGVGVKQQQDALAGQLCKLLAEKNKVDWQLLAKTGATSTDLITSLSYLTAQKYDYVLVSIGVNDVTHPTRASVWQTNLKTLISLLETKFDSPKIIFTSVPPMQKFTAIPAPLRWCLGQRAKKLNNILMKEITTYEQHSVINFDLPFKPEFIGEDGIHPSKIAYSTWAKKVAFTMLKH